jgi:hypothetical protein
VCSFQILRFIRSIKINCGNSDGHVECREDMHRGFS